MVGAPSLPTALLLALANLCQEEVEGALLSAEGSEALVRVLLKEVDLADVRTAVRPAVTAELEELWALFQKESSSVPRKAKQPTIALAPEPQEQQVQEAGDRLMRIQLRETLRRALWSLEYFLLALEELKLGESLRDHVAGSEYEPWKVPPLLGGDEVQQVCYRWVGADG